MTDRNSHLTYDLTIEVPDLGTMHVQRSIPIHALQPALLQAARELGSFAAAFVDGKSDPQSAGITIEKPPVSLLADRSREPRKTSTNSAAPYPYAATPFPAWLKDVRAHHGWSQAECGHRLGVSGSTVSLWERGKHQPRRTQLDDLSKLFTVPIRELQKLLEENDSGQNQKGGDGAKSANAEAEEIEPSGFDESEIILPALVKTTSCRNCDVEAECKSDQDEGLPAYCENVNVADFVLADQSGKLERLKRRFER